MKHKSGDLPDISFEMFSGKENIIFLRLLPMPGGGFFIFPPLRRTDFNGNKRSKRRKKEEVLILERFVCKKHNKWFAVLLVFCLLASVFTPLSSALALEPPGDSGSVTVRIEGDSSTLLAKTTVPLEAFKLSDSFKLSDYGLTADPEEPTALHALILALKAHDYDATKANNMTFNNGMLTKLLGVSPSSGSSEAWLYRLNNISSTVGFASQPIQDGDNLVIYFVKDWAASNYAFFNKEAVTVASDTNVSLTLKECILDTNTWQESQVGCADATITVNGTDTAYKTDSDGKVTLNFTEEGTYEISAKKISSDPAKNGLNLISLPYCKIVVDNTAVPTQYDAADLKSLAITAPANSGAGLKTGLSPAFSYATTSYTCALVNSASQLQLSAEAATTGASIQCWTSFDTTPVAFSDATVFSLPVGESTVYLEVSPPTGDATPAKIYQIRVTRAAAAPAGDKETSLENILAAVSASYASTYDYWKLLDMTIYGKDNVNVAALLTQARQDLANLDMTSSASATTLEKIILALSSRGYNAAHFSDGSGSYIDLVGALTNLSSMDYVNTYIYGLMALDSGNYEPADDAVWSRDDMINGLLGQAYADGGFGFGSSDPDITAMAVTALASYYDSPAVKTAVDKAMTWLSTSQNDQTGGFSSWGAENSNSAAMVMIALVAMGKDPDSDPAFVKNGKSVLDALLSYETAEHFLKYTDTYSDYSTEQGFRALSAYTKYLENGSGALPVYQFGTPDKTGEEEVTVTALHLVSGPSKISYSLGDSLDTTGMALQASYSDTSLRDVAVADCTFSGFSSTTAGTKTVTVAFGGAQVTFSVTVKSSGGGSGTQTNTFTIKVVGDSAHGTILPKTTVTGTAGATVFELLQSALGAADIDFSYNNNSGSLYVSSIAGLSEFDNGPDSGWLYYVNGKQPSISCGSYQPKNGDTIEFRYSDKGRSDAFSDGDSTATAAIKASLGQSGVAQATVSGSDMAALLKKSAAVTFEVQLPAGANGLAVNISKEAAASFAQTSQGTFAIESTLANLQFDAAASAALADTAKESGFTVTVAANSAQSAKVGGRPVYDFTVQSGGKELTTFGGGSIMVEIPYTLQEGEDPNAVIIYYINAQGALEAVTNSHYNAKTKTVIFTTDHFSTFAVGYHSVSFSDTQGKWMETAVSFLAARDIVKGAGSGEFQQQRAVTRAEFVTMLMRALVPAAKTDGVSQFADITADAYYYDAVLQGKALGLLNGDGGNLFAPGRSISRQEMFVIAYRALEKLALWDGYTKQSTVPVFSDQANVAAYAQAAVSALTEYGLIGGFGGKVEPAASASRSECAQFLFHILTAAQ